MASAEPEASVPPSLLEELVADPTSKAKRAAYVASLPKDGSFHIVEGDLLMTKKELNRYINGFIVEAEKTEASWPAEAELVVNCFKRRPDYWPVGRRRLTYAVNRESFPNETQYNQVVLAMSMAAEEWESVCKPCGIDFVQIPETPGGEAPVFTVKAWPHANGQYFAVAFRPHYPRRRRVVKIDPSYFTQPDWDPIGILRHELGHVLGYRHEHTRTRIRGCRYSPRGWLSLTPDYDAGSVMHAPCEGDAGNPELTLSPDDKFWHHALYTEEQERRCG